jgi:hypothetical protein
VIEELKSTPQLWAKSFNQPGAARARHVDWDAVPGRKILHASAR